MTTEDDFQAALDVHPDDWQTRLVFADWLEERDDPRAEGYRALGVLRKRPLDSSVDWHFLYSPRAGDGLLPKHQVLPMDWYVCLPGGLSNHWPNARREAEDAAALAFARLPAARRRELLENSPVPT